MDYLLHDCGEDGVAFEEMCWISLMQNLFSLDRYHLTEYNCLVKVFKDQPSGLCAPYRLPSAAGSMDILLNRVSLTLLCARSLSLSVKTNEFSTEYATAGRADAHFSEYFNNI